jgi:hypothetical protein
MPSDYQRLYPEQETLTFDGGQNSKFNVALIPENESPDCLNVVFGDGSVGTREGAVKLNTAAAGSVAFDGLYTRRANDGTETMVAFIGGHMLALNATTFVTVPSAQSVFTSGFRVGAELAENRLFAGNGGALPYKWDGTYFTRHGVYAPTQTMVAVSGTTGSLTTSGVYRYAYTNVNSALVESDLSPITTFTVSTVGRSVVLSSIASGATASMGISTRRIYRTLSSGTAYFRLATLSDVSTTTYTDVKADADLGAAAPTDNGVPPLYNAICYHRNILFVNDTANPNYVWYSEIGQPYTFPSSNFIRVGDNTSYLVLGFESYDNYIVVFCEQSTWINYMPDPATPVDWRQIKTNSPYGSDSPYCLLHCNVRGADVLLHPTRQNKMFVGFASLTGTTLDPSVTLQPATTAGSDLQSQVIEPDMFLIPRNYSKNITGIVYKNKAYISVTYGVNQTTNNRIYVWDFSMSNVRKEQPASWSPWEGTGHSITQFAIYDGKLYGASATTNGFVYRLGDTGVYADDSAAIDSYWWSKEYSGFTQDTASTKDFRYINILVDNAGSYSMNLKYRTDSDRGAGTTQAVDLSTTAPTWNGSTWNGTIWSAGVGQSEKRVYLGGSVRGLRLQIRFDNQNIASQRFRVHRGQLFYNIRGYR